MSTVVSELAGAIMTSAAPEVLPMAGSLAGKLFGVPVISRIVAGTMWNLSNKKPTSDVEMREMGRSSARGRLRGRAMDRAPAIWSSRSGWDSKLGIRLNRTHENNVIRRKQRFVGLMTGGQLLAGATMGTFAMLAHLSILAFTLSPVALGCIGLALALNGLLSMCLADHYKMDKYTQVPQINESNWDLIDPEAPINQSNLSNTLCFGVASLLGPLSSLYLLFSDADRSNDERERYLANN